MIVIPNLIRGALQRSDPRPEPSWRGSTLYSRERNMKFALVLFLSLFVIAVLSASVEENSLLAGSQKYYGRVFGTVSNWYRKVLSA